MPAKNPRDMMQAVTASMQERTGRTLEEWVALVEASGLDALDQQSVRRWLKAEHGVLQNSQWAIADAAARAAGWTAPTIDEYVAQQYDGAKASLRPVYERLHSFLTALGDDVSVEGRATYIPFVRARQFVAVAAATRTRVDVGLRYTKAPRSTLLVESAAPGQATHKLSLHAVSEITAEVEQLLRAAYEQNGASRTP
jgi:predicted transport protein